MENEQKALTPQEFISLYQSNPKPMPMTNEEKIQELLSGHCWDSKPYLIGMDRLGVEDVMERFAEWKDEKEIEFLQSLMFQASTQQALNIIINNRIKLLKGE